MSEKNIATFTGPQKGLTVIGEHAYALSGAYPASTDEQTVLDFTTGNYVVAGKVQLNAFVQLDNVTVRQASAKITFNGNEVALLMAGSPNENAPFHTTMNLIIPPRTEVIVTIVAETGDANNYATVGLTGRVYTHG
jgi:hypothetical protein